MQLNRGDFIKTTDCHHQPVEGEIIQLLDNTVVVAQGEKRFVVPKKILAQAGYTFPRFKKNKSQITLATE